MPHPNYDNWKTTDPRDNEPNIGDTDYWGEAADLFDGQGEIAKAREVLFSAPEEYGDHDENWHGLLSDYTYTFSGFQFKPTHLGVADQFAYIILCGLAIGTPQGEDDQWAVQRAEALLSDADGELIAAELLRQRLLERVEGYWLLTGKGHDALRKLREVKENEEE